MSLPTKLFFTGVPGSKWSGISQVLERMRCVNTSDHSNGREYSHGKFSGHKGSYFGTGMEFPPLLTEKNLNKPWYDSKGMKIIKSHEWAYNLETISVMFPDDWIMLVYRPDAISHAWWHEAGGFNIKYPDYSYYENSTKMLCHIQQQNQAMLEWSIKNDLTWSAFTPTWVKNTFGEALDFNERWSDVLVTVYKGS